MPPARQVTRRAGHHDVELAKVRRSYEIGRILAWGVVGVFWIAALSLPLWVFQGIIEPLAGKTTRVDANVVISLTLSISLVVNVAQYFKVRSQRAELERQRERMGDLEGGDGP